MKIDLSNFEIPFLGIIIHCSTGLIWTNQVGGTVCGHPEIEGVFVPLPIDWLRTTRIWEFENHYIDSSDSKAFSMVGSWIVAADLGDIFEVPNNFSPVTKVAEAWIPVIIKDNPDSLVGLSEDFKGKMGVITYMNSD